MGVCEGRREINAVGRLLLLCGLLLAGCGDDPKFTQNASDVLPAPPGSMTVTTPPPAMATGGTGSQVGTPVAGTAPAMQVGGTGAMEPVTPPVAGMDVAEPMAGTSGEMMEPEQMPREPEVPSEHFSFFVTSMRAMQELSGNSEGFGGDLRFGETGPGAGLRGADKICAAIAERSMDGASAKGWRAFLSATADENGDQVNAVDRIGEGPWYDRLGRLFAQSKADLFHFRPEGADPAIANDFPNEDGVPNQDPDATGAVDNHDTLTGTNAQGQLYSPTATCLDWTSSEGNPQVSGRPRVGHSWPRNIGGSRPGGNRPGGPGGGGGDGDGYGHWMSSLDEAGCGAGINIVEMGGPNPDDPTVGSGGGYGGIYCFALTP